MHGPWDLTVLKLVLTADLKYVSIIGLNEHCLYKATLHNQYELPTNIRDLITTNMKQTHLRIDHVYVRVRLCTLLC